MEGTAHTWVEACNTAIFHSTSEYHVQPVLGQCGNRKVALRRSVCLRVCMEWDSRPHTSCSMSMHGAGRSHHRHPRPSAPRLRYCAGNMRGCRSTPSRWCDIPKTTWWRLTGASFLSRRRRISQVEAPLPRPLLHDPAGRRCDPRKTVCPEDRLAAGKQARRQSVSRQRCGQSGCDPYSECGVVAACSRRPQECFESAEFVYAQNSDLNAAGNILASATARRGTSGLLASVTREVDTQGARLCTT